jgi:ribose/xylose/arabinose/galactoside ABC-type transport system permease subunit
MTIRGRVLQVRRFGLWIVLAVVVGALAIASPTFRQSINIENILEQQSILGIVACGMAVMMISGGFDLSVGATGATASVLAAVVSQQFGAPLMIASALLVGLAVGVVNGILIAWVRINPFVATFAMASIVSGLLFVSTEAQSKSASNGVLATAATGRIGPIPVAFLILLGCVFSVWLFLTRTKYGHYVYSVGGNSEASYLSGVPVQRVQVASFAIGGIFAGGAGVLLLGQTEVGQPSAATHWPLEAIAICVVGGVALSGGVGSIIDVLAATILLGVIANGLNQLNVSPYWQPAITGLVILVAVILDQRTRQRSQVAVRTRPVARPSPELDLARTPVRTESAADVSIASSQHPKPTQRNIHS